MVKTKREVQPPLKNPIVLAFIQEKNNEPKPQLSSPIYSRMNIADMVHLKTQRSSQKKALLASVTALTSVIKLVFHKMADYLRHKADGYYQILMQQSNHEHWTDPYAIPIKIRVEQNNRSSRLK